MAAQTGAALSGTLPGLRNTPAAHRTVLELRPMAFAFQAE